MSEQSTMSPKMIFWSGFGVGIGVIALIGFVIMLTIMLKGGTIGIPGGKIADNAPAAAVPSGAVPEAPSGVVNPPREDDHIRGNVDAKVAVIEFSDFECPFCKRFHPTMQQLMSEYEGKVSWVYRHFPLISLHPQAPKEAEASECAAELGGNDGFWRFTDRLYEVTPGNNGLDLAELPKIAAAVGLDQAAFESCLNSGKYAEKVNSHYNEAAAAGCRGTPCSIILAGDQKLEVPGAVPYEQLKAMVDSVL